MKQVVKKLKDICDIQSGYITRGKIEAAEDGSHYLLQAKDVDAERLSYQTDRLIRFHPTLSRTDKYLEKGDLLFMARGVHNVTIQIHKLPNPALAAACFFIMRVSDPAVLPGYLSWYMNQSPVTHYLSRQSGRSVHMPVVRRAVLENIEVPVPPMDTQRKITEMDVLMLKENHLLEKLARKRKDLVTAACMRAIQS